MNQIERRRAYYQKNKEQIKAKARAWYEVKKTDPEWRKQFNKRTLEASKALRLSVVAHYGDKCACCGEARSEFMTLDHIANDGAAHRRSVATGGYTYWNWFVKNGFPLGFQVLCMNCNFAKGMHGECPHKLEH